MCLYRTCYHLAQNSNMNTFPDIDQHHWAIWFGDFICFMFNRDPCNFDLPYFDNSRSSMESHSTTGVIEICTHQNWTLYLPFMRPSDKLSLLFLKAVACENENNPIARKWITAEWISAKFYLWAKLHQWRASWSGKQMQHVWTWWLHQMETCSTVLSFCARNSPVTGEFPTQRPVTWSFDVFFDLRPNQQLSKQWRHLVIWDAIALIMTSL